MVQERIQKLHNLRDQGIDPYPAKYERTHTTQDAKSLLETIEQDQKDSNISSSEEPRNARASESNVSKSAHCPDAMLPELRDNA